MAGPFSCTVSLVSHENEMREVFKLILRYHSKSPIRIFISLRHRFSDGYKVFCYTLFTV